MRPSSSTITPTLRRLKKQIARAHGPLWQLAAHVHSKGLLTDAELRDFQADNKTGGERKVYSVEKAKWVLATWKALEVSYQKRLQDNGLALPMVAADTTPLSDARQQFPHRTLAERSVEEHADLETRNKVANAMSIGFTARQALEHAELKVTKASRRWAQRLYLAQRLTGDVADQRTIHNGARCTVLQPEMRDLIEVLWMRLKKANCTGLRLAIERHVDNLAKRLLDGDLMADQELLAGDVRAGKVLLPSTETIRRFLRSLPKWKWHVREHGWNEHTRQKRPIADITWANYANEEWQADHTPIDAWAKVERDGLWAAVMVTLTIIIDIYSRAIMGVVLSERDPDAFTTAHALRMAILPKAHKKWLSRGTPERLVLDNGKDFRSQQVSAFAAALNVNLEYCAPRTPDEKPHIERFFRTLTGQFLPTLPGYKHGKDKGTTWSQERIGNLLTVPQLRMEILRWIQEEYHSTVHGEEKSRTPMDLWQDTAVRRVVPPMRELDVLLLYESRRRVARGVVRMTIPGMPRGIYWAPALTNRNGSQLVLKYNPDDLASIYAYDADSRRFVGELWNLQAADSPFANADARDAWWALRAAEQQRTKSLDERVARYHAESATEDRVMKRRTGRDMHQARLDAAQAAAQVAAQPAPVSTEDVIAAQTDADLQALKTRIAAELDDATPSVPSGTVTPPIASTPLLTLSA